MAEPSGPNLDRLLAELRPSCRRRIASPRERRVKSQSGSRRDTQRRQCVAHVSHRPESNVDKRMRFEVDEMPNGNEERRTPRQDRAGRTSKVGAAHTRIALPLFMSLSFLLELAVPARAIDALTSPPARSWHSRPTGGAGYTLALRRLSQTPVYRSVDSLDESGEAGLGPQGDESDREKILFLHGQLKSLRRQLELELAKKSKTKTDRLTKDELQQQQQAAVVARTRPRPTLLGSPCLSSSDCNQTIALSHCKLDTFTCACLPQHVEQNSNSCLAPALLGYECTLDGQCEARVAGSSCQLGKCACRSEKSVAYRKHKCLPAANLNDYCLADDQCRLADPHSFCKWKIPNVYGTCKCPPNYKLLVGDEGRAARCAPRLGDTCLSDRECQQTTANSICATESTGRDQYGHQEVRPSQSRRRGSWTSSGASDSRCTCAPGFGWSSSQLECLRRKQLDATTTTTTPATASPVTETASTETTAIAASTQALDSHKYETVIAKETEGAARGEQTTHLTDPATTDKAQGQRESAPSELEINFVSLDASASSTRTPTSTPSTTTTSTSTTEAPRPRAPTTTTTTRRTPANGNSTLGPSSQFRMSSLGKPCQSRRECQARDPYSDCVAGTCECLAPSERCGARATGCHPDTFQCRNGQCISWYFVCDHFQNCDDGSDEEACQGPREPDATACPPEAFQCHSDGACVSLGALCNGKRECADASDELGCQTNRTGGAGCPQNSFACSNGQCLPAYVFCNAVEDCSDASDEDERLCERKSSPTSKLAAPTGPASGPHLSARPETAGPSDARHTSRPTGANLEPGSRGPALVGSEAESPLVKTDRASIERLMAALALTQRTPEKRGRGRRARLAGAPGRPEKPGAVDECPRWAFTCANGKCRSSAILCSGVDGCGDNSDEDRCEVCQCEPPPPARHVRRHGVGAPGSAPSRHGHERGPVY